MLDAQATARFEDGTVRSTLQARVLEGERIAVLVSRLFDYQLVVLDADGEEVLRMLAPAPNDTLPEIGAQLATGPNGDLIVGVDGYVLWRVDVSGDRPQALAVERERREFYYHPIGGLALDAAGAVFVATQEGLADERREVIDRFSPDLLLRQSARLELSHERCTPLLDSHTKLHVSENGERFALLSHGCFVTGEWPSFPTQ